MFNTILFTLALLSNAITDENSENSNYVMSPPISLCFSHEAIAFESGQPVFSHDTQILLLNANDKSTMSVSVNDEDEIDLTSNWVNISELTELRSGTYTVVVTSRGASGIENIAMVGFTLK